MIIPLTGPNGFVKKKNGENSWEDESLRKRISLDFYSIVC